MGKIKKRKNGHRLKKEYLSSDTRVNAKRTRKKTVGASQQKNQIVSSSRSSTSLREQQRKRPVTPNKVSKKKRAIRFKRSRRMIGQLLLSLFLTIGLIWLISVFTFTVHRVDSYMMMPALTDRDLVFVNKVKTIRRFDLILLRNQDGSQSVRRVIGVPGDRLYYKNDQLYLNNEVQVERFITRELEQAHQSGLILTEDFSLLQATEVEAIPKDSYFVLGDNRQYAEDSRSYGLVKSNDVIGIVQVKLLPLYDMRYLQ